MNFEYRETPEDLQTRIDIHRKYGARDIDAWMLSLVRLQPGMRILDVGCGAGKQCRVFYEALAGRADIVGGDVSAELLEAARGVAAAMGGAFQVQELDFNRPFPFPQADFDLVSCCFAIYYAHDIPFTIGEMHRVLRGGGQLFLSGPMPDNKQVFYEIIREATHATIPPMPGSSRYGSEILTAVRQTFPRVELHIFENPLSFHELDPFLAYTRASLSEDRKLWQGLFQSAGEFDQVMQAIARVAAGRLAESGELVMTKVVGGIVAAKDT
jgi:ubiquinone/menaquinone biosynthesis C-methylase UbiE